MVNDMHISTKCLEAIMQTHKAYMIISFSKAKCMDFALRWAKYPKTDTDLQGQTIMFE